MYYYKRKLTLFTLPLLYVMFSTHPSTAADTIEEAIKEGKAYIDMRYRYEYIDEDGKSENAHGSTLRTRIGVKSGEFHNFAAGLEFENITRIGDDKYNDTINGKTDHPTVADPETDELNLAYLTFSGLPQTQITAGRQVINLGNQRFVGEVGWRQNNQTFDAIRLVNDTIDSVKFDYIYVDRANRIFGSESSQGGWNMKTHLANISIDIPVLGKLTPYMYLMDIRSNNSQSNQTYGASLKGNHNINNKASAGYYLEYAKQKDYADNTTDYETDYYHIVPSVNFGAITFSAGYEVLGSDDGAKGFATPLATAHKFNGWSDKFLTTPSNGLRDAYVSAAYKLKNMPENLRMFEGGVLKAAYHEFETDENNTDLGEEYNIYAKVPISENYFLEAKYTHFNGLTTSYTDKDKITFGAGLKY